MIAAKFEVLIVSVSGPAVRTRLLIFKDESLIAYGLQDEHLNTSVHSLATHYKQSVRGPLRNRTHPALHSTLLPICLSNSHLPCSLSRTTDTPPYVSAPLSTPIHCKATACLHSAPHSIFLLICLPVPRRLWEVAGRADEDKLT
jgi:hypothetical protein